MHSARSADVSLLPSQIETLSALIKDRPDDFAGLSIDEAAHKIIVHHAAISDPVRIRELVTTLPGLRRSNVEQPWSVELRAVSRSHRQLKFAFDRILKVEPWATQVRSVLAGWEMDVERNVVAVNVTAITPELRDAATRTFGSAVELRLTETRGGHYSRSNDWAPWYGGIPIMGLIPDAFLANQLGLCTAGFPVSDPTGAITGLITAGHCFGSGDAVTQQSDGEWVGGIIAREDSPNGLDYELIAFGDSYGNKVWISEHSALFINNPDSSQGIVTFPAQVGTAVCFDGARTGEKCNAKITSLDSCQVNDNFSYTCSLVTVKSTDGKKIAGPGDSGGPVYRRTSSLILPEGIIIGGNGSAGTVVWYHPVGTILNALANYPIVGGFGPWHVITQ
ncbi:MAG TPA: S1 family peptidase [Steroidobacteraceae bacterium]|nr:S1 family peptidase [Steroidobacteraceae bacterium]